MQHVAITAPNGSDGKWEWQLYGSLHIPLQYLLHRFPPIAMLQLLLDLEGSAEQLWLLAINRPWIYPLPPLTSYLQMLNPCKWESTCSLVSSANLATLLFTPTPNNVQSLCSQTDPWKKDPAFLHCENYSFIPTLSLLFFDEFLIHKWTCSVPAKFTLEPLVRILPKAF